MHPVRATVVIFAGLLVALASSAGQDCWTPLGPEGATINQIVVDPVHPSVVYATTEGIGVVKSVDGGKTWQPRNQGITTLFLRTLALDPLDPDILYAGAVNYAPLFKSVDGGEHWSPTTLSNYDGWSVVADPVTEGTVYAASGDYVARSADGGQTWQWISAPFHYSGSSISKIVLDPSDPSAIYICWGYNGVYVTRNSGASWTALNAGLDRTLVEDMVLVPGYPSTLWRTVYGSTPGRYGVLKSVDGGATWVATTDGMPTGAWQYLSVDPENPSSLYASNLTEGLFHTPDGGATWQLVRNSYQGGSVRALAVAPLSPAAVFVGTYETGLFLSEDEGHTWRASNSGLIGVDIGALVSDVGTPTTLYATSPTGAFKSEDGGAHWSWMSVAPDARSIQVIAQDPTSPNSLYAGSDRGRLWKSTDRGLTWEVLSEAVTDLRIYTLAVDPFDSQTLYMGGWDGFYKSTDGGVTWVNLGASGSPRGVYAVAFSATTRGTLVVADQSSGLYRTTDGGSTWTHLILGASYSDSYSDLIADRRSPGTLYFCSSNFFYKSSDLGTTWSKVQVGLVESTALRSVAIDPSYPSFLYTAGWGGVFRSVDGGATWNPLNKGLEAATVNQVLPDPATPGRLYALPQAQSVVSYLQQTLVTDMKKSGNPFRITVAGQHLLSGIRVFINGVEWTGVTWKNEEKLVLKGSGLKTAVRKYIPTEFRFENPDGSYVVRTWSWP